ncbi:MAG: hypothetical protein OEZ04_01485 [Nitrospinota bacterium]|nr:hypothetical protein [Nitrospinota bacterium]
MKLLGEKSLSSILSKLLHVLLYVVPVASIFIAFILSTIFFSDLKEDPSVSCYAQFKHELFSDLKGDDKEWQEMKKMRDLHPAIRVLAISLLGVYIALLFQIIRKSKLIFDNFRNNIVFSHKNVLILSGLTKLVIIFSIISANFSSLLLGIILLILTDILKNGTALQEEHDLTI